MEQIPKNHPRYDSLMTRQKLAEAMKQGLVHKTGLIAHGRGEAFDYLLGETTTPQAAKAEKVAAALLLVAQNPVLSVNGNVAALAASSCVRLSEVIPAKLEVNLFHRTPTRVKLVEQELKKHGAETIYGVRADARIPSLDSDRGLCDKSGIFSADVVLVPLEDGDRCQALRAMGKTVIAIDLNPLSRTARTAHITIVDNVIRAIPAIEHWAIELKKNKKKDNERLYASWDNNKNLKETFVFLSKRLNSLF